MTPNELTQTILKYMNLLCFSGKYSPNSSLNYISDLNQLFEPLLQIKFFVDHPQNRLLLRQSDVSFLNKIPLKKLKSTTSKDSVSPPHKTFTNGATTMKMEDFIKEAYNISKTKYSSLSVASRRRKLSALKNFSLWCLDNDLISTDPLKSAPSGKLPARLPEYLNLDEIMTYFKSLLKDFESEPTKYKNEFILFLVLYGCGLRIEEACSIKNEHIEWNESRMIITGKGSKVRFAILPDFAKEYLKRVILTDEIYIYGPKKILPRTAYNWIQKRGVRAGLHKPIHPHMFRHTYATHLLREKTDLRHLQELLGHSSLVATQRYTHLDKNQLLQSLEEFHPLSKDNLK